VARIAPRAGFEYLETGETHGNRGSPRVKTINKAAWLAYPNQVSSKFEIRGARPPHHAQLFNIDHGERTNTFRWQIDRKRRTTVHKHRPQLLWKGRGDMGTANSKKNGAKRMGIRIFRRKRRYLRKGNFQSMAIDSKGITNLSRMACRDECSKQGYCLPLKSTGARRAKQQETEEANGKGCRTFVSIIITVAR
jgi:hypothetical protein